MFECDTLGCPEYVSHPGQICIVCTQRQDAESDPYEEIYDPETGYDYILKREYRGGI